SPEELSQGTVGHLHQPRSAAARTVERPELRHRFCWGDDGKTTTLKVAASNWGDPDERSDQGFIHKWHVTKVFIERAISVLNFLPMILDDTKTVRFKEMVGEVIYQVVSGKGKGRGTIGGMSLTRSQKTVLISSGE